MSLFIPKWLPPIPEPEGDTKRVPASKIPADREIDFAERYARFGYVELAASILAEGHNIRDKNLEGFVIGHFRFHGLQSAIDWIQHQPSGEYRAGYYLQLAEEMVRAKKLKTK